MLNENNKQLGNSLLCYSARVFYFCAPLAVLQYWPLLQYCSLVITETYNSLNNPHGFLVIIKTRSNRRLCAFDMLAIEEQRALTYLA